MKAQIVLPLSIAVSLAAFALIKMRVKEFAIEEKKAKFQDVKLRVTDDVLMEYEKEVKSIESKMESEKAAHEELTKALAELNKGPPKTELDACTQAKKKISDDAAVVETQFKTFQAESTKAKTDWEAEIAALNDKLNKPSPICNYLKAGSSVQGFCHEKKEEPKVEPPKPVEEKKETPKVEEKKETPKVEEKKEPPKVEEKKEPPKVEEKKEPPKVEEKKEPPKEAEAKPESPKKETPKPEAPKQ